jgi:hypothetical protein
MVIDIGMVSVVGVSGGGNGDAVARQGQVQ